MRHNPLTTHCYAGIASRPINTKAEIRSYADAYKFLGGEKEKKLGSNLLVHVVKWTSGGARIPFSIAIKLYGTDIITYHGDNTFEANNGGFNTPTTSSRCNQFCPKGWRFAHENKKLVGCFLGKDYETGSKKKLPTR